MYHGPMGYNIIYILFFCQFLCTNNIQCTILNNCNFNMNQNNFDLDFPLFFHIFHILFKIVKFFLSGQFLKQNKIYYFWWNC